MKGALSQDDKGHGNHEDTFSSHFPAEAKLFPLLLHNGAISLSRDKWWMLFQCLLSPSLKENKICIMDSETYFQGHFLDQCYSVIN